MVEETPITEDMVRRVLHAWKLPPDELPDIWWDWSKKEMGDQKYFFAKLWVRSWAVRLSARLKLLPQSAYKQVYIFASAKEIERERDYVSKIYLDI